MNDIAQQNKLVVLRGLEESLNEKDSTKMKSYLSCAKVIIKMIFSGEEYYK